jgi:hypothetical protein
VRDKTDLDVYRALERMAGELDALGERAVSPRSSTALAAAAALLRKLARAIYKAGM